MSTRILSFPQLLGSAALCTSLLTAFPASAFAQQPAADGAVAGAPRLRHRIAIDQFKWEELRARGCDLPAPIREGLQAQLVDRLQKSGHFIVMERELTAQKQGEEEAELAARKRQQLASQGVTPPAARQVTTPADFLITPTVIGYQTSSKSGSGIRVLGQRFGKDTQETSLVVNIRISDAQTSEMLDSQTAEAKSTAKSNGFELSLGGIDFGSKKFQESPVGQAMDQVLTKAVNGIVQRLGQEPWHAVVAGQDASTGRVILATGATAGVTAGQEFCVYRAGGVIRDPQTGDVLTQGDETLIGRVRVTRVERNVAFADVLSGDSFQPMNVIRLPR